MTDPIKISWSEIKTFQRCPKQHEYKYVQGLTPKKPQRALLLGSWVHKALETFYRQGDWKIGYNEYLEIYDKLFAEEKIELNKKGPLPELVLRVIKSYLWYTKSDPWKVLYTEVVFQIIVKFHGLTFRLKGIIDLIVEDEEGNIWIIDHKTASSIPDPTSFHAMDPQLMIYPWAAKKALGIDAIGIIYNYVQSKPPSIPKMTKGGQISKAKIRTDYPTLMRFLKDNDLDPQDWMHVLRPLKRRSPFLRRYKLPREPVVTKAILEDILTVATHIATDKRRTRTITRDCARMCSFHDLCRNELNGFDTTTQRRAHFTIREDDAPKEIDISDEEGED